MCTLEELKAQNEAEHIHLQGMIKSLDLKIGNASVISKVTKWIAGMLLVIVIGLLSTISVFSGLTYSATSHAKDIEVDSYKVVNALQDTISEHWKTYTKEIQDQKTWTHSVYLHFILPADSLSKINSKLIKQNNINLIKYEIYDKKR